MFGKLPHQRGRYGQSGFSLVEALIALSITSLAGAVLLLSVQSALDTTIDAVDQTIADGIAQQTLDEILTKRYEGPAESPTSATLGPSTSELLSGGTAYFDDADDYAGYAALPVKGWYGELIGSGDDAGNLRLRNFRVRNDFFQNWRVRVNVYYVNPDDHTLQSTTPTYFRGIEVTVEQVKSSGAVVPLASRKRVVTYLPPPPT